MNRALVHLVTVLVTIFGLGVANAQNVDTRLTHSRTGSFVSEVGFQFINVDNRLSYYCEPFGGTIATNVTVPLPPGNYEVRAFDSYGDSWNNNAISLSYSATGVALFTDASMTYSCGYCPFTMTCPGPTDVGTLGRVIATFTIVAPCSAPTVTSQPVSQTVCAGAPATFSVVSNMGAGSYEWRRAGTIVAVTTVPTYTIPSTTATDGGLWDVVLRPSCNTTVFSTSSTALLTVVTPPVITQQPASSRTVCENANDTLRIRASGAGRRFQWRRNGVDIVGATDSNFVIQNMTTASEGNYDCVVTGTCAPPATSSATTVIAAIRPRITTQPVNIDLCPGTSGSTSVAATGSNLTYQWFRNDVAVPGAIGSTLSFTNYATSSDGLYYCMVSSNIPNPNNCPLSVRSASIRVAGFKTPTITSSPKSSDACVNTNVSLVTEATGSGLNFQWLKNGSPVPGATSNELMLRNVKASDGGVYRCRVTGTCGLNVTTDSATITVIAVPVLTESPKSQTLVVGSALNLMVNATDWRTLQWMKNNQPIVGATSPSLSIPSVSKTDAGYYYCIVRNSCGGVTSATAEIKVNDPTVPTPELLLSQPSVDFGEIPAGYEKSVAVAGLIQSTGTAPLVISGLAVSSSDFTITNAPSLPLTLAPGESQTVTIKAAPTRLGGTTSTLVISSNAPSNPNASVGLSAAYVLRYEHPTAQEYGKVFTDASSSKCFVITNTSGVDIVIDQTTITGANSGLFTTETTLPLAIAAGQTGEMCVKFTPGSSGTKTATLNIRSSSGGNSSVALSGEGEIPAGVVDAASVGVSVSPNPTTDVVDIRFSTPTPEMMISLIGSSGRTIAQFNHGAVEAGGTVRWNGRDASGAPVASGSYTMIVRYGEMVVTIPLSIVR